MLQRGTKNFHIVFGELFVASMESAAMVKSKSWHEILWNRKSQYKEVKEVNITFQLLSTSMSYFTVLYSTR